MRIAINCSDLSAVATLEEADDFSAFDAVIDRPEHVWVTRAQLVELAGPKSEDQQWRERLDGMITYAASKGWVDEAGRIRAHVADLES